MGIEIVRGTNQKPVSSDQLVKVLEAQTKMSGQLFVGYPIIGTAEGPHIIDALLVSKDLGIAIICLVEGTSLGDYEEIQDDSVNKLESKLKLHRELVERRNLLIPIHAISFAPGVANPGERDTPDYPISNGRNLVEKLSGLKESQGAWERSDLYDAALSVIENISTIRQGRSRRIVRQEESRGAKLKRLEESIATLDNMQGKAVIETVEGVQRIRGLAGSGKTIVLALKAAYLHAQHPDWRIAVTFNTRSLKGQFRRLIHNFCLEQTSLEPNWENLRILNAWGRSGRQDRGGMYREFCRVHNIPFLDFRSARAISGIGSPFTRACELAIGKVSDFKPMYDAILVDEAQDFSPAFLRLCHMFLKEPKRLVYAYDELQNLTEESLPSPEHIFERNGQGGAGLQSTTPGQNEASGDIVLQKCYRNSGPILVTAHALGFGIYRRPPKEADTGLVQMFENAQLWDQIGYEVADGSLTDGQSVVLRRTPNTSPTFLADHSSIDDLIQFKCFNDEEEQAQWLANAIKKNLEEDELRHDDIVVINPDPRTTRSKVGRVRRLLMDMGVNSHLAGVDTDPDVFFTPENSSVTFTGVFRAKGNEAGMVYVMNSQDCHADARNLASIRNQLFTAVTRSKAWVRVLGIGDGINELASEYEELKKRNFELSFVYPDAEQRKRLRIIHRDMTNEERQTLQGHQQDLSRLVEQLEVGQIRPEDLDEKVVKRLKDLLG